MPIANVVDIKFLSTATFLLTIERPDMDIRSGQCFNLGTNKAGVNREYSMYSDANADHIEFLIRAVEHGVVSPELASLKKGDQVRVEGPYGEFCIDNTISNKGKKFTFIATGTGIAPFRSFVKTYPEIDYEIIHGVRFEEEQYNREDYINGCYIPCISRPSGGKRAYHVTDYVKERGLNLESTVFICGNRKMIAEIFEICHDIGINGDNIFTEAFF